MLELLPLLREPHALSTRATATTGTPIFAIDRTKILLCLAVPDGTNGLRFLAEVQRTLSPTRPLRARVRVAPAHVVTIPLQWAARRPRRRNAQLETPASFAGMPEMTASATSRMDSRRSIDGLLDPAERRPAR